MRRRGFLPAASPSASNLAGKQDERLFSAIFTNQHRVLRALFSALRHNRCELRPRSHGFSLPEKYDRNFILMVLYSADVRTSVKRNGSGDG